MVKSKIIGVVPPQPTVGETRDRVHRADALRLGGDLVQIGHDRLLVGNGDVERIPFIPLYEGCKLVRCALKQLVGVAVAYESLMDLRREAVGKMLSKKTCTEVCFLLRIHGVSL